MRTPVDAERLENESRTRTKVCVFIALMVSSDKKLAVDDPKSRFEDHLTITQSVAMLKSRK